MSQRPGHPDVQLSGHNVTQYIMNMRQRDEALGQNFKICRDAVMDAAQLYAEEKDQTKFAQLREQFVQLVEQEHQLQLHKQALHHLQTSYQPSLEGSNFESVLQQHMQQLQAHDSFTADADGDVREFDELARSQQQEGPQEEELDDDEGLVVVGNVDKNDKCPYTRKDLADLDEPLEDQMGFVYEGAAIRAAIRAEQRNGYNWIECPLPGVSHQIFLNNLKPANKRRLQRLAKLKQQQQQGMQAAHGRVVLDA